jgi:hypothetical protein
MVLQTDLLKKNIANFLSAGWSSREETPNMSDYGLILKEKK